MSDNVSRQYATADPLTVRLETHRRYSEHSINLDAECASLFVLSGHESVLDAGCGPGSFLLHLHAQGHAGRLSGLDQSPAMIAELNRQAQDAGVEVEGVVGDVQDLPFPTGMFDRVAARHMLYHVPDIRRALAEIRRIAKPDGLMLFSTNSQHSLPRIEELLQGVMLAFGFDFPTIPARRFGIENAPAILQASGIEVREHIISNALVFDDPAPIVAYCLSTFPTYDVPGDSALQAEMEEWLTAEATACLQALGGVWRDPKDVGIYTGRPVSAEQ